VVEQAPVAYQAYTSSLSDEEARKQLKALDLEIALALEEES